MRISMKDAMERARANKAAWGGEWEVYKDGDTLWIRMVGDVVGGQPPPTSEALCIYRTSTGS